MPRSENISKIINLTKKLGKSMRHHFERLSDQEIKDIHKGLEILNHVFTNGE